MNDKLNKSECQVSHGNFYYTFNTYNKEYLLTKKNKRKLKIIIKTSK